jgi:tetratricopeptide (TPR) repeat protein
VAANHTKDSRAVDLLLADLQERVIAYARGGRTDPTLVLSDEAEANAYELWRAAQDASRNGSIPFDVVYAIALLHYFRYLALPVGQDRAALQVAVVLFAHVYRVDPERVPKDLLELRVSEDNNDLVIPDNVGYVRDKLGTPASDLFAWSSISYPRSESPLTSSGPDWWTLEASSLLRRKQTADNPDALDRAIDLLRSALHATLSDDPARVEQLTNLAGALGRRHDRGGNEADLEEAITAARAALEASSDDDSQRPTMLSNLGVALRLRFERDGDDGDIADLEEAIRVGYAAVESAPADHPSRAGYESNLARAVRLWPQ